MKKSLLSAITVAAIAGNVTTADAMDHIKWEGDFRYRIQSESTDKTQKEEKMEHCIRARIGATAPVNEMVTVGVGLASGSNDADSARSTNQTLDDAFSSKGIVLDYAYATITPMADAAVTVGKMKNPLWRVSDLMWDKDIRPEGVAARYDAEQFYVNAGYFALKNQQEKAGSTKLDDMMLLAIQPGTSMHLGNGMKVDVAASYYQTSNLKDQTALAGTAGTNTLNGNSQYADEFQIMGLSAKLTAKNQFSLPYTAAFVDYITNSGADDNKDGYLIGVALGNEKVNQAGKWQGKLQYRELKKDATLDILPDSNAYGGKTGVKGLELILSYGIAKNTAVSLDYYSMENIDGNAEKQDLIQLDLSTKF